MSDAQEAAAAAYLALPSNWTATTPYGISLAEKDAFNAGWDAAMETLRALPEFVKDHIQVSFQRGTDPDTIEQMRTFQSPEEKALQELITSEEAEEGYVALDLIAVNGTGRADGITSVDPTLEGPLRYPPFTQLFRVTPRSEEELAERWPMHRPILDIDFPAALIPSTTPGHFHLYLDKPMPFPQFKSLLEALGEAGIIEHGYAEACIAQNYSSVRLPWVTKEAATA